MRLSAIVVLITVVCLGFVTSAAAKVNGPCSDCHTMHNSQDGSAMNFDASATPNPALTRGGCGGCHAQNTTRMVGTIPQVMHTDTVDLAGGNFAYIYGGKGSGKADSKGHNVIDLGAADADLTEPPGSMHGDPTPDALTCAGLYGCHGGSDDDPFAAISGAHHADDSTLDGTTVGKSYRFLKGVVGLEAADWENRDKDNHNEYHDHTTMATPTCTGCHVMGKSGGLPAGSGISDLCVMCHRDMHLIDTGGDGVWIRHPAATIIPNSGEYAAYTEYNVDAPVGRVVVPETPSSVVTPGTDTVTCLSCHVAHGSDYPDLLRWDYTQILAGLGDNQTGCFICHTTKDD